MPCAARGPRLGACADTATEIDTGKLERAISDNVTKQTGAHVTSVTCPDAQAANKGAAFTCVVTGTDGTRADAAARVTTDDGFVKFHAPFLRVRNAERIMSDALGKKRQ